MVPRRDLDLLLHQVDFRGALIRSTRRRGGPMAGAVAAKGRVRRWSPDPTCVTFATRRPECKDGIDNDGDGRVDLDDSECGGDPTGGSECTPPVAARYCAKIPSDAGHLFAAATSVGARVDGRRSRPASPHRQGVGPYRRRARSTCSRPGSSAPSWRLPGDRAALFAGDLAAADVAVRAPRFPRVPARYRRLWFVGSLVEKTQGTRRFAAVFFAAGIAANLAMPVVQACRGGAGLYDYGCVFAVVALFVAFARIFGPPAGAALVDEPLHPGALPGGDPARVAGCGQRWRGVAGIRWPRWRWRSRSATSGRRRRLEAIWLRFFAQARDVAKVRRMRRRFGVIDGGDRPSKKYVIINPRR